jgi:hypothetical protein
MNLLSGFVGNVDTFMKGMNHQVNVHLAVIQRSILKYPVKNTKIN